MNHKPPILGSLDVGGDAQILLFYWIHSLHRSYVMNSYLLVLEEARLGSVACCTPAQPLENTKTKRFKKSKLVNYIVKAISNSIPVKTVSIKHYWEDTILGYPCEAAHLTQISLLFFLFLIVA